MAVVASAGGYVDYVSELSGSIVKCCYCRRWQHDPLLLSCLHNCCRSCLESVSGTMVRTAESLSSVRCPTCHEATKCSAVTSNGLLSNYRRLAALNAEVVRCSGCDAKAALAVVAEFWCADCCAGLCGSCYSTHNRFYDQHRSAELEVARTWSLSQLTPAAQCNEHEQPMDVQCFTCLAPKCYMCYESCRAAKHDLRPLLHDETRRYVFAVIKAIMVNRERLSRAVSGLQMRCIDSTIRLQGACRTAARRLLLQNRRSLYDAVVNAYNAAVLDVGNLRKACFFRADVATKRLMPNDIAMTVARKVHLLSIWHQNSMQLRRQGLLCNVIHHCSSLFKLFGMQPLKNRQEGKALSIHGSVPLTADITLEACLGATYLRRAAPFAPLLFDQASVTFMTPFGCSDMAVTPDGCVLLAARKHGLLVYSDRGQQLSSWRPARRSNGRDDAVSSVAALSSRRAAVGVFWAQLVVLLKLSEMGDSCLEDRRVVVLQSPPKYLAVCADLLATTQYQRDEQQQQQRWLWCREVKLLRMSSGKVIYTQSRDYDMYTIALTALCVVTTSRHPVMCHSGATVYVVDAFSHSGQFLWRYKTSDDEGITGVCAAANWNYVYSVVAMRQDWRSSKVVAIGGADGRNMREVLSSRTHKLPLPEYISLGRGRRQTVLAVLSFDEVTGKFRTITLYEATSSEITDR